MKTGHLLIVVLALAALVRVGLAMDRDRWPTSSDEAHWENAALAFYAAGLLHPDAGTYRPPLYALFVTGCWHVFGSGLMAVRLMQAALGVATCWFAFTVGQRAGGERTGLVACALCALHPLLAFFTTVIMAETLLVFLVSLAVLLALRTMDAPTTVRGLALGLVLGLAALCKPVVLAWAVPLVFIVAFRSPGARHAVSMTVCAMLLTILPWSMRNRVVTDRFVLISSNIGMNLLVGHEPGANGRYRDGRDYFRLYDRVGAAVEHPVDRDRLVLREVGAALLQEPMRTVRLGLRKLVLLWNPLLPGASGAANLVALVTIAPIVIAGLIGLARWRHSDLGLVMLSLVVAMSVVHAVFFAHVRFRLPVDAVLVVPAADRLLVAGGWVRRKIRNRWKELLDGAEAS